MKRTLKLIGGLSVAFALVVSYTNCSSYVENDVFQAPSVLTVGNANPLNPFLQAPLSQVRGYNGGAFIVPGENSVHIAGFCSPGPYQEHYIEFKLVRIFNGQTFEMSISKEFDCDTSGNPSEFCRSIKTVKCEQGRYSLAIPITTSTINSLIVGTNNLTLRGQMVVKVDGSDQRKPELAMNPFTFQVTRQ